MTFDNFLDAAIQWHCFGFNAIPLKPNSKVTTVRWDEWLNNLTEETMRDYWDKNPDHEIGHICDEQLLVIDADSPQGVAMLYELEEACDVVPNCIFKTSKGEHHYFRRAPGTYAQTDSHSTKEHPERLDIKTGRGDGEGRSMVVLPPSKGKSIELLEADSVDDLTEVGQDFIDAIWRHNGKKSPRAMPVPKVPTAKAEPTGDDARFVQGLLKAIPSDCGYQDWLYILMGTKHTLGDTESAFAFVQTWSGTASNYCGTEKLRRQWDAIKLDVPNPITIGTLIKRARDNGADIDKLRSDSVEQFERLAKPTEVIYPKTESVESAPQLPIAQESQVAASILVTTSGSSSVGLSRFSLSGMSAEFEKQMREDSYVLPDIALRGQSTVIYAKHNVGKTLLAFHLLMQAIESKLIDPGDLFYFNADDNHTGLTQKLKLAEEYGFHIVAPGHKGFKTSMLLDELRAIMITMAVTNAIIILDTLKKFADLMDKRMQREFGEVMRMFILRGGTFVGLAHINKKRDPDGKAIYSGTSDQVDDCDCGYILDILNEEGGMRTVEFENIKCRGKVARLKSFQYSLDENIDYFERLISVRAVSPDVAQELRSARNQIDEKTVPVDVIKACILDGFVTKMKLATEVADRGDVSKRLALQTIERFTGDDPGVHHWNFKVVERGAKQFYLLQKPENLDSCEPAD